MDTIEDIRRGNLRRLAAEFGGQQPLADVVGIQPAQISQWVTGAPNSETGTPRAPSSASCRRIEARTGKPRGWMDHPPADLDAAQRDWLALWDRLDEPGRRALQAAGDAYAQPAADDRAGKRCA